VKKLKNTPVYVKPQITSDSGTCRISVLVGIRSDPGKTIESITLSFQLPHCVSSADLSSNHGTVTILSNKVICCLAFALNSVSRFRNLRFLIVDYVLQTCTWTIGRIPKDKTPCLSGTLALEPGLERLHVFPTFKLGFKIMGIALSGLRIEKLDLQTIPPRLYKGFRAQTRAGEFDVRL
jgi:AP-3 complex subunit mu